MFARQRWMQSYLYQSYHWKDMLLSPLLHTCFRWNEMFPHRFESDYCINIIELCYIPNKQEWNDNFKRKRNFSVIFLFFCFIAAQPDVSLLYSTPSSIWSVSVYFAEQRVSFTRIPIQGQHIIASFYNAKEKFLYWADSREQKIYRSRLDGTNQLTIIQ
jgi:hypothetical protein